jgi:hypothetical protein
MHGGVFKSNLSNFSVITSKKPRRMASTGTPEKHAVVFSGLKYGFAALCSQPVFRKTGFEKYFEFL